MGRIVAIAGLNAGGGNGRRPSLTGNGCTGVPNAGEEESAATVVSSCTRRKASIALSYLAVSDSDQVLMQLGPVDRPVDTYCIVRIQSALAWSTRGHLPVHWETRRVSL
jgi:hypothetical protein